MQEEPIFGNSGIKIILIEKKEYYLIYDHENIPQLTQEKYDNIVRNKAPDINLGTIILYDKQKTKDGKYIKITPIYRSINKQDDINMDVDMENDEENNQDINEQKDGILMTDAINLNLLESDFSLLNKVMMILEGRNSSNLLEKTPSYYNFPYLNNKNNVNPPTTANTNNNNNNKENNAKKSNDVLKIDFNEKKLKIISIVNKGINMILFSIDINIEYILNLSELLDISIKNFKKKSNSVKNIDKAYNSNLKMIDELNLKKTTMTRINKEKNEKLMNFIITELNKKKKNNFLLNEKINSLFSAPEEDNKMDKIDEDKNEDKESDISLGSIAPEEEKKEDDNNNDNDIINTENKDSENKTDKNDKNNEDNMDNDPLNDSNLSLTDL